MSHFKRRKPKRKVRCCLCTKYRWMGNKREKKRFSELRRLEASNGRPD